MRITLILAVVLFTLLSCSKEDEWQTVNISGSYTNTPDVSGGFHSISLPTGGVMQVPKKYKVGGSDNIVDTIDDTKSTLERKTVSINAPAQKVFP